MELLERESALADLDAAFGDLSSGEGSVVLIAGEAGIGKTRLVREFAERRDSHDTVLWGACDDLSTPRPLGPFRDLAMSVGGALRETLAANPARGDVFDALLDAFASSPGPTAAVIEDVHWADAATLDVVKFLGRRIDRIPIMLVATYRSDEITTDHPLTLVLGDLPGYATRRIDLAPLSKAAVTALGASYPGSVDQLYAATAGNPFLVTEALSMPEYPVPPGVRDAVGARVMRLGSQARALARAVAVVPGRVERRIIGRVAPTSDALYAECRARGLLEFDATNVWYRHELVRGAVHEMLTDEDRTDLNLAMVAALIDTAADVARIVHHARAAGDGMAVAIYGPLAGAEASAASSHREALAHYRAATDCLDLVAADKRAALLLDYAVECYLTGDSANAMSASNRALDIARADSDRENEGVILRWLSRFHWWLGQAEAAERTGRRAVELLESVPDSAALPMAYSNLAQLHMLAQDAVETEGWARKAIEAARRIGDTAALAHALNNLGSARARSGDFGGLQLLEESLDVSLRDGLEDHAGRAYSNLIWTLLDFRRFDEAKSLLERGIAYATERELEGSLYYMVAERARLRLLNGDWDGSERDARWVIGRPEEPGITRMPALATLAQLLVRRGDRSAAEVIDNARELVAPTGELQRLAPVALAAAEYAWLEGDLAGVEEAISPVYELGTVTGQPWVVDELAFWMWRSGAAVVPPAASESPYAQQMKGAWERAAEMWQAIGCPYERAMALFDSPDEAGLMSALGILDELGAVPAARLVRRKLRALGVQNVQRGPRPSTRSNPAGLTARQFEVAALLVEGLTNAEIAERLFVSPKTVDHHVSAVLAKLGARSRREAARTVAGMGLDGG